MMRVILLLFLGVFSLQALAAHPQDKFVKPVAGDIAKFVKIPLGLDFPSLYDRITNH